MDNKPLIRHVILQSPHEAMACMNIFSFCHLLFLDSRPLYLREQVSKIFAGKGLCKCKHVQIYQISLSKKKIYIYILINAEINTNTIKHTRRNNCVYFQVIKSVIREKRNDIGCSMMSWVVDARVSVE